MIPNIHNPLSCKICDIHKSLFDGNILIQNQVRKDLGNLEKEEIQFFHATDHWVLREAEPEKSCKGYLYLEPRKHSESFTDISSEAYKEMGVLIEQGMHWIEQNFHPKKIYTLTISEAVPHIHFHLVPRYKQDVKGLDYLKLALGSLLGKS
ncbi:MAG: HIT family hydrolase [Leptospiraceae bacterium]|nr:HIT family hydrolase [Leptospiraceae bacterium]